MEYPLISEYREAILSAEDNFNELASLRPVLDSHGDPVMSSGNFAIVFKMKDETDGKLYAVKCFIKDQEGRDESYRKIADELEVISSSYILPLRYIENELFVDSTQCDQDEFPVVVMEWVEGETLDVYLKRNLNDKYALGMLSYRFNRMSAWLLAQPFAHGDLKPDNILIREDGSLVLVDYDGMFVPSMQGEKAREIGSPDYRHPLRTDTDFNEHIDDFSIAVITLSLKAISLNPQLKSTTSDILLLSEKDFRSPSDSTLLSNIQKLTNDSELSMLLGILYIALAKNSLESLSFKLFMTVKPKQQVKSKARTNNPIEKIDTSCSDKDLAEGIADEYGVLYSPDGKRLLKCKFRISDYTVRKDTQIICDNAFSGSHFLKNITIPNSVTAIGNGAFSECNSLRSITIPNSVTAIGNGAFSECSSLRSITIPDSVTAIKANPFVACKNLKISLSDESRFSIINGLLIDNSGGLIACITNNSHVIIPRTVTTIGENAFSWDVFLQSIKIPNSVTTIGNGAFSGCDSLRSITIPDSVISIGNGAFLYCDSLQSITIPDSVISIGNGAFSDCESLRNITIPDSVITLGSNPFESCKNLNISLSAKSRFSVINGLLVNNSGCLIACINNDCNVIIPRTVTTIGENAFSWNTFLQSIEFPNSITTIENGAFSYCKSLRRIIIPNSVTSIGSKVFSNCEALQTIDIPPSVTEIGNGAFSYCDSLQNITIPKSVTSIGDELFSDCKALQSIDIPPSVTEIGNNAFSGCKSLMKTKIPQSVTNIGNFAFIECETLENITIPESVVTIGSGAFFACRSLRGIIIPNSITTIRDDTFSLCSSLKNITIPKSVTTIERRAFSNCSSLLNVTIPNSVTTIGNGAFSDCTSLRSITIPDSVISIGNGAFSDCYSLRSITIPDSVISIGSNPFSRSCKNLNISLSDKSRFSIINGLLVNNSGCLIASITLNIEVIIPSTVTTIGENAFSGNQFLQNITIPNSVTTIGDNAFLGCSSLQTINIPDSITSIGKHAFSYCKSLQSIHIPDSIIEIGYSVFWNCDSLESITIPEHLESKKEDLGLFPSTRTIVLRKQ